MIPGTLARRLAAGLLDALILTPPSLAVLFLTGERWALTPMAVLLIAALDLVYRAGFEASGWRATPGKRLLGLAVTTLDGGGLGLARAILRTLPFWGGTLIALLSPATGRPEFTALAWLAAPACLLWLPFAGWRRALHDVWAGAVVGPAAGPPP
ncbi:MAG: RDD family protein [Rhodospirillales bacterium]|nr:MAG: RDD family protein [Rhodospirillales bacterium]